MKKMLVLMAVLAFSSLAMAQTADPDADGMGIYFDTSGTQFCQTYDVSMGYTPITAYLVLTHPSTPESFVLAWEARLTVNSNATIAAPTVWSLAQGTDMNFGTGADHIVGTTTPPLMFTGDATVLASVTLSFLGIEVDPYAAFTIDRVTNSTTFPEGAGYASEVGFPIPCQHIFGAWGTPSAWVNYCPQVVANEDMTWGQVKSLY